MRRVSTVLLLVVALVNLAPVVGVISADRLQALYGIQIQDPNLAILMRHRALLFAVVGGLLVAACVHPPIRTGAIAAGLFSMLSFVVIAWLEGGGNPEIRRVGMVDVFASLALLLVLALDIAAAPRTSSG